MATTLNNLAEIVRAQGAYAQAEPLYKRAMAIRVKLFGATHASVVACLASLTELQRLMPPTQKPAKEASNRAPE